jgi:hypothetical protein
MSIGASIDGNAGTPASTCPGALAVANASKRRRSRKRRPDATAVTPQAQVPVEPRASGKQQAPGKSQAPTKPTQAPTKPRQKAPSPTSTLGQRPRAPWHPLPLSEILILIGAIATIIALRNRSNDTALLVVGLVAVGIGTFEVTLREHWSGYRSHAILLALVPVLAFHSLVIGVASLVASPTVLLSIVLLPFDLALFLFLFKLLRARFLDARQLRTLGRR